MTDKEQNRSEVNQEPISKDITGMNSRGKDRRRFIKRAIVAAPFILTVASRPVWAANCTLSGQLSGNLSDAGDPCGGEGCSVEYWRDNINNDKWHYAFPPDCEFDKVFGTNVFGTYTLFQVISRDTPDIASFKIDLGSNAVAAAQNAATDVSFDFTVFEVIDMVSSAFSTDNGAIKDLADLLENTYNNQICPYR